MSWTQKNNEFLRSREDLTGYLRQFELNLPAWLQGLAKLEGVNGTERERFLSPLMSAPWLT
jgi:hypothetical protein